MANTCLHHSRRFSSLLNLHLKLSRQLHPYAHHQNCLAFNYDLNKIIIRSKSSETYQRLHERGLFKEHFPAKEDMNKFLSKKRTIYAGFDATADSLHVGNLLVLIALLHLRKDGHRIIVVIGDATAMIGDPSGKTHDRPKMNYENVMKNARSIAANVRSIFDNHSQHFCKIKGEKEKLGELLILNNNHWYKDMNVIQFMSSYGRYMRLGDMLYKSSVKERLQSTGLNLCEFSYQMFQSYDWLHLFKNYNCEIQIGAIDQTVNVHQGHDMIKKMTDKESYAIYLPLITDNKGNKLGKSEEHATFLDPNRLSPYNFYQFFLRLPDTEVHKMFKLFSFRNDDSIEQMYQKQLKMHETWYFQKKLAEEMTLLVHGEKGLMSAKRTSAALFSSDVEMLGQLSDEEINDVFEGAHVCSLLFNTDDTSEMTVLDLAIKANCFATEKKALDVIQAGGFFINYKRVTSPNQPLSENDILPNDITLVRVGKRAFHVIKWH